VGERVAKEKKNSLELKDLSHSQSAAVHSKSINIKNETWLGL
jgi:hypothetical protein